MRLLVAKTSLPHLIIKKYLLLNLLSVLTLILYIYIYIYIIQVQIIPSIKIKHFSSHR